ncbi:MAG TPA: tripartite tricarboxylate transporter substrate binding protein [Ramlibacter sp.]|nr:tripartite tricarboxylate transporter substrate binding protein [Ramlibacter sp.]
MKRRHILLAAGGACIAGRTFAQQAPWPSRPVRWIVPWGAGGAADLTARTIAQKLGERWGQQVNVDNKPGGGTIVAAVEAARAAPDGYTLFMPIAQTMTSNQYLYSKLPYDPMRDFTPICMLAGLPLILLASGTAPASALTEIIELARKNPDTLTVGSAGGSQIQVEQWMRDWGVKFRFVPYKSGIDVTKALLSGEIQYAVDAIPGNLAHIRAGKMKGVALNTSKRMSMVPEVPTLDELRIKHTEPQIWHALVAPARLPPALQSRIYADVQAVLAMPEVHDRLSKDLGVEPILGVGAEEFMRRVRAESAVVGPLVKELGLKVE